MTSPSKKCSACQTEKPIDEFGFRGGSSQRKSYCKECAREQDRARYWKRAGPRGAVTWDRDMAKRKTVFVIQPEAVDWLYASQAQKRSDVHGKLSANPSVTVSGWSDTTTEKSL